MHNNLPFTELLIPVDMLCDIKFTTELLPILVTKYDLKKIDVSDQQRVTIIEADLKKLITNAVTSTYSELSTTLQKQIFMYWQTNALVSYIYSRLTAKLNQYLTPTE